MFTRKSIIYLALVALVVAVAFWAITPPRPTPLKPIVYHLPLSIANYPALKNWRQYAIHGEPVFVLLPRNYSANRKYPILLYLHQLGAGDSPEYLMEEINPWFGDARWRSRYQAIVIAPLLDQRPDETGMLVNFGGVTADDQPGEDNAVAAISLVENNYSVDKSRVYVTGNSMGGIGAWDLMIKYNAINGSDGRVFAAGMPLAGANYDHGYPVPSQAVVNELRSVPIWSIHGARDTMVPLDWDRAMGAALAGSRSFHFTLDPSLPHDVWHTYYPLPAGKPYWDWLFSQRFRPNPYVSYPCDLNPGQTARQCLRLLSLNLPFG